MSSIRTLKVFLTVARLGSFAAAGTEVGLTAAAVGQQIKALEAELRKPLFDRSGRRVVLNGSGRGMVAAVQELVARFEALRASPDGDALTGTVVMGALVSALMGAFADSLGALTREHPLLEVTLFAGQSADFATRVERGELDAAVVTQPPMRLPPALVWKQLYTEPMVLIVPSRTPFTLPVDGLSILAQCPFLRFDRTTWTGHLVDEALAQCNVTVHTRMELNSLEAIVALVRQGFGISIVPRLANLDWSKDRALRIVPLPQVTVQRAVGLLERRQHSRERVTLAINQYFARQAAR
ncbi:MAG: LysR family transcriptional regulator [Pseudomonadota bacterium]|nr:LysR family transcriptional regulator [Pseudomonadota bacterium]